MLCFLLLFFKKKKKMLQRLDAIYSCCLHKFDLHYRPDSAHEVVHRAEKQNNGFCVETKKLICFFVAVSLSKPSPQGTHSLSR